MNAAAAARPTPKETKALDIQVKNEAAIVVVTWGDGHTSTYPVRRLRGGRQRGLPCRLTDERRL